MARAPPQLQQPPQPQARAPRRRGTSLTRRRRRRPAPPSQSVGRRSLAIRLLEDEPSAAQQVPLLLSLAKGAPASSGGAGAADGEEDTLDRALRKAVEARDPDLLYLALFAAYRSRPLPEFWGLVAPRPTARHLFVKYCRVKVRRAGSGAGQSARSAACHGSCLAARCSRGPAPHGTACRPPVRSPSCWRRST